MHALKQFMVDQASALEEHLALAKDAGSVTSAATSATDKARAHPVGASAHDVFLPDGGARSSGGARSGGSDEDSAEQDENEDSAEQDDDDNDEDDEDSAEDSAELEDVAAVGASAILRANPRGTNSVAAKR